VPPDNAETILQLFDAFNSEDMQRVLELTHADFEVTVPAELSAEPDVYRGHDGMRRYFESFRDAMEEIRFRSEGFRDAGEDTIVAMRISARGRRTGIPVEQHMTGVWTVRDGKVLRVRVYESEERAPATGAPAERG
jgi:ketosteroid isomerase-like protein